MALAGLAIGTLACGRHPHAAKAPSKATASAQASPDAAKGEVKTIAINHVFERDDGPRDFEKTVSDGFERRGLKVDDSLTAHAHFDVHDAKITGTVTYAEKDGKYTILEADLVTEGHYDADVQLELERKLKGDKKKADDRAWDKTILSGKPMELVRNIMPATIPIAGSLALHAHFDLAAACDFGAEGQLHATSGVGIAGDVRMPVKYRHDGIADAKTKFAFEPTSPTFELAPRPYLKMNGKPKAIQGRCSLQPTAVILLDPSVGAKLTVEPWLEMKAKRAAGKNAWRLDTQAGVSVNGATDVDVFGRALRKSKEVSIFDVALGKQAPAETPSAGGGRVLDAGIFGAGTAATTRKSKARAKRGG